jgi:predicted dehydrogenase
MATPPIRLGIIGAGIMGVLVARAAAATEHYTVTAVADPNLDRAARLARELGAAWFPDAQTLLAAGLVDAVYVGVPHHLHLPVCVQATAAGVHGLVDKPLCNTDDEASAIESAVRDSATVWMVGFSYRFRAEWRRAREFVAAGRIGDPLVVSDVIAEAAQGTPGWYWDPGSGGGVLQLQSHHCFDRIEWMLGRRIREISCRVAGPPSSAETAASITAGIEGGALATVALTFGVTYSAPVSALFVLQGTRGQLEITQDRRLTLVDPDGVHTEHHADDDWLGRELLEFADAVRQGKPRTATLADGRRALRCALASARSAVAVATIGVE